MGVGIPDRSNQTEMPHVNGLPPLRLYLVPKSSREAELVSR